MTPGLTARSTIGRLALLGALALGAGPLGGCDTIGQDLGDLAKSIIPPSPGEAARMAIDPNDPDLRRQGTLLLANAPFGGSEPYLEMYRDYVQNETNPLVKAVAIRALGRHGTVDDARLIATQLDDGSVQVRWEAAKALQRLHNPIVVPALLVTLRKPDEHSDVRVASAVALGQYAQDRVFQGLVAALDARQLSVNLAAELSLYTLTGQELGSDPRTWLNWYNANADNPFGSGLEFLYPTYERDVSLLEKMAFWSTPSFETPSVPTGLRPSSERSTYQDDGASGAGDDGRDERNDPPNPPGNEGSGDG